MKLTVDRFTSDNDSTISAVYIDGIFECFGLEDEYREEKMMHETRIPAGKYKIGLYQAGRFHGKYSKRYPNFHRGMLYIQNVPNFSSILIHSGNTDDDTSGCLLVGRSADSCQDDMRIASSREAYASLYQKVVDPAEKGELEIEYIDQDLARHSARVPEMGSPQPVTT